MKEKLHFSNRLAELMKAKGINPAGLAKKINVSHVAIGNFLKKGQIPKSEHLFSLALFFNVTMEELLTGAKFNAYTMKTSGEGSRISEPPDGALRDILKKTALSLHNLANEIDNALKKY